MNIRVYNCKSKVLKKEITSAINFYAQELLTNKMIPNIFIDVVFKPKLDYLGSCSVTHLNDWYKPREFEIELLRRRSKKSILITLAHEMVHLKQFATCELKDDHTRWKGKTINSDKISYDCLPWEVEAESKEFILYALYCDSKAGK